jgi:hypothetical protein
MEINLRAFKHLTLRDLRALGVFFGIALLCSLYFVSGILVTYVSSSTIPPEGTGYTVWVLGLQTHESAELLSTALINERRIGAMIQPAPDDQGYLVKIGPLINRQDAENLDSELKSSGYKLVKIIENCPPGNNCIPAKPKPGFAQGDQVR